MPELQNALDALKPGISETRGNRCCFVDRKLIRTPWNLPKATATVRRPCPPDPKRKLFTHLPSPWPRTCPSGPQKVGQQPQESHRHRIFSSRFVGPVFLETSEPDVAMGGPGFRGDQGEDGDEKMRDLGLA